MMVNNHPELQTWQALIQHFEQVHNHHCMIADTITFKSIYVAVELVFDEWTSERVLLVTPKKKIPAAT